MPNNPITPSIRGYIFPFALQQPMIIGAAFPFALSAQTIAKSELSQGKYRAQQVPGAVVIFAEGWHSRMGYKVWFEKLPTTVFPPEFALLQEPPNQPTAQVLTPFAVWVMFASETIVEKVNVHDANGVHEICVEQTPDIKATADSQWVCGNISSSVALPTTGSWISGG